MPVEMPMSKTSRSQRCIPLDVQRSQGNHQWLWDIGMGDIQMADEVADCWLGLRRIDGS